MTSGARTPASDAATLPDTAPISAGRTRGDHRAWARQRETAEHGGMLWLGLVVGLFLLLPAATPRTGVVFWGVVLFVTLLVSLRYRIGPAALLIMVVAGFTVRLVMIGASSSDALIVTVAAIERVLGGGSPWGVGYAETIPPGAPFPYGPLALLWYLPAKALPEIMEMLASTIVLVLLGIRGRPVGLGHLRLRADAHRPRHGRLQRLLRGIAPAGRDPRHATVARLGRRGAGRCRRLQDLCPGLAAGAALVRAAAGIGGLRPRLGRHLAARLRRLGAGRLPGELLALPARPPPGVLLARLRVARHGHPASPPRRSIASGSCWRPSWPS